MPLRVRGDRPVPVGVSLPRDLEETVTRMAIEHGLARSHVVVALLRRALQMEAKAEEERSHR